MKMTSKEALENIKENYPFVSPVKYQQIRDSYIVLEQLVERDTPMTPIFESIELICPKCREGQHTNTARFCSECGQRLDWSKWK